MHLTVDHAPRNDIVIGIASRTRLTSGVSQIKNVVPSVGDIIWSRRFGDGVTNSCSMAQADMQRQVRWPGPPV
jgi:aromatic ring hydroxylase